MKLGYIVCGIVLMCAVGTAQDVEKKSKTKLKVEDGKATTVTGCVERSAEGDFMLTNVAGKEGALGNYILAATDDDNLDDVEKHVGHRVEVTGKAADQGKGKVTFETKTEGTSGTTESKSEVKGNLNGLPFLGVRSLRMIASVCP
jgi:hypothetical protein